MNKKFFSSLSIIAVALALVLGFGSINAVKAVPGENGDGYTIPEGTINLFGADDARNSVGVIGSDADFRAHEFAPEPYGLWGTSQN